MSRLLRGGAICHGGCAVTKLPNTRTRAREVLVDVRVARATHDAISPIVDACEATDSLALVGALVLDSDGHEYIAMLGIDAAGPAVAYRKMWLGGAESRRFSRGPEPQRSPDRRQRVCSPQRMADVVEQTNLTREQAGDLKQRKRLSTLTDDELAALREAFRRSMALSDSQGYGHFASLHGFPDPGYCEHRNQLFLPWHRGYLYHFERSLQDLVPGVTLPWWDWTGTGDLPEAYAGETASDGSANPLTSAAIVAAGGTRQPDWPEHTSRMPGRPGTSLPTEEAVNQAMRSANYDDFAFAVEQLHNAVHRFVGGEMVDQRFAGWDPIFWAHHTMVDRLWALWQLQHPGDNPAAEHLPKGLNYFKDMTVADTLDFARLGYDYAADEVLVQAA